MLLHGDVARALRSSGVSLRLGRAADCLGRQNMPEPPIMQFWHSGRLGIVLQRVGQ